MTLMHQRRAIPHRPIGVALACLFLACVRSVPTYETEPKPAPSPLVCTREGLIVRRAQFAAPEPIEDEDAAEPIDAVDEFFNGPTTERGPVFSAQPKRDDGSAPILDERTRAAIDRIIAGATITRSWPDAHEHHLFPRERFLRPNFDALMIDVDAFTILVDRTKHSRAHDQQARYGPGGRWNEAWRSWFRANPRPTTGEAFEKAASMIQEFRLEPYALLAPYGCGRIVAHDLYDIVEPR